MGIQDRCTTETAHRRAQVLSQVLLIAIGPYFIEPSWFSAFGQAARSCCIRLASPTALPRYLPKRRNQRVDRQEQRPTIFGKFDEFRAAQIEAPGGFILGLNHNRADADAH